MYETMKHNLQNLLAIYNDNDKNRLVCLEGRKGSGKTTVINSFIEQIDNVMQINPSQGNNYLLPIIRSIQLYCSINKIKFDITLSDIEYAYEELVMEQLLKLCTTSKCCIIFNRYTNFSTELIEFIQNAISNIFRKATNCMIIIEIDTDDIENKKKLQSLYMIPRQEHLILKPVKNDELVQVFFEEYNNPRIDNTTLSYIINSAEGNPALLNIIINYLRSKELFYLENNCYYCKKLEAGTLSDILKEELFERFNHLDDTMKMTFLKSSMLGMEFYIKQLSGSFQIIAVSETLKKIEHLSNLLIQNKENLNLYFFPNDETYIFAKSIIPVEQKMEWAEILYNYYITLWEKRSTSTLESHGEISLKIADYAMESNNYEISGNFYIAAIFYFIKVNNFQQALIIINQIEQNQLDLTLNKLILMHLKEYKAICFEHLGLYQKACDSYKICINEFSKSSYFDILNARYQLAFCTYYTSKVNQALEMAESLKKDLEKSNRTDALYYKVLSLLATLYREKGNAKEHEMFLIALDECKEKQFEYEYHVQLRKSDLCYDVTLSLPMIRQAACYFFKNHYKKEYGKATQNIGTGYLYIGKYKQAYRNLKRSQKVFSSFGSTDEVYAINCLGVWYATVKQDYLKALTFFEEAQMMEINDFKKMTVWANMAACYLKLHQNDKCLQYIKKCEEIPARKINKDVGFYQRTVHFLWAFHYMDIGEYNKSIKKFRECLNVNLKNDQYYLASSCIVNLCKKQNLKPTNQEITYSRISHSNLYEIYYNRRFLLHTLRFIE